MQTEQGKSVVNDRQRPSTTAHKDKDKSKDKSKDDKDNSRLRDPSIAAVMTAYLDKINPTPSQSSLDELKGYVEEMGAECCLRAFDIALDAKKTTWPYIRAVLRSKLSQGVRCLADWDEADKKHEQAQRVKKGKSLTAEDVQPTSERIQKNNDWLDKFLSEQERMQKND